MPEGSVRLSGSVFRSRVAVALLAGMAAAGGLACVLGGLLWGVLAVAYGGAMFAGALWWLRREDERLAAMLDAYAAATAAASGSAAPQLPAAEGGLFSRTREQVATLCSTLQVQRDGQGPEVGSLLRFAGAETDAALVFSSIPELVRLLAETRVRGSAEGRRSLEMAIPPGSDKVYRVDAAAVVDRDGDVLGVAATFHDLDTVRSERAQHAEFVSAVAHELKTPMAGIKAFIEMLMDGDCEDPEEQREVLQLVDAQVDRLTRMVNSVLNLARIESGVIEVKRVDTELNAIVRRTLEIIEPVAAEKGQTVVAELSNLYLPVHVDPDLLGQAVLNLVSNAVKYTPQGGEIRLRTWLDESSVGLEVQDNGIGIPADALPRVFERFYRVPQNERAASGTGLGLSLVRYIVEDVHQGEVAVTSEVGEGTCFSIRLPSGHRGGRRVTASDAGATRAGIPQPVG